VRGAPTREGAMSTVLQSTALHTAMHTATHNATHTATRIATHTNPSNHNDTGAYQQQRAHMHAHAHSHTHAQGVSLGGASSATTLQHASPASATSPQHASRQEKRGGKVGALNKLQHTLQNALQRTVTHSATHAAASTATHKSLHTLQPTKISALSLRSVSRYAQICSQVNSNM